MQIRQLRASQRRRQLIGSMRLAHIGASRAQKTANECHQAARSVWTGIYFLPSLDHHPDPQFLARTWIVGCR